VREIARMPVDRTSSSPAAQNCEKCGAVAELATFVPRFGERPAYRIFECEACKALTWIAEALGK
jgi:hypothetical protein